MTSNTVFVTGNANKAHYFSKLIGMPIDHQPADVPEIQSLDLAEVVVEKAKAAFAQLSRPVIVEDTSLVIKALGQLPGPFIKWFIQEMGLEKICRLADATKDRTVRVSAAYAYYDGHVLRHFLSAMDGFIADQPKGDAGFGWNPIFIPEGPNLTLGEMSAAEFDEWYVKIKPILQVKQFLQAK